MLRIPRFMLFANTIFTCWSRILCDPCRRLCARAAERKGEGRKTRGKASARGAEVGAKQLKIDLWKSGKREEIWKDRLMNFPLPLLMPQTLKCGISRGHIIRECFIYWSRLLALLLHTFYKAPGLHPKALSVYLIWTILCLLVSNFYSFYLLPRPVTPITNL